MMIQALRKVIKRMHYPLDGWPVATRLLPTQGRSQRRRRVAQPGCCLALPVSAVFANVLAVAVVDYAWRREGIAGLAPKARLDRGQSRISAPIQRAVPAAKRDNPRRSVRQIVHPLEAAGTVASQSLSRSAVTSAAAAKRPVQAGGLASTKTCAATV